MRRFRLPDRATVAAPIALAVSLLASACAPHQDHVVFVTRTSLGVDFDSEPPAASIGYDRVEGYLGPRAEDGSVPPVLASIQSDGGVFNNDVRQTYATGAAAVAIARGFSGTPQPQLSENEAIEGKPKLMFFGTSSTAGLKIGFTAAAPSSVTFGYKRKEVSVIPLARVGGTDEKPIYKYPSVVASIDTTAEAGQATGSALTNAQFFATGLAAEHYGRSATVQEAFRTRSAEALQKFDASETRQRRAANDVLTCYGSLVPEQRSKAWDDAFNRGLLKPVQEESGPAPAADEIRNSLTAMNAADASRLYATYISHPVGFEPGREATLAEHSKAVCTLAGFP